MIRLLCLVAMSSLALAQAPDSLWMLNYGRNNVRETGGPAVLLPGSGILVFGSHVDYPSNPWIVRVDAQGDTLWTRTWDSLSGLQISQAFPLTTSTFLVAGTLPATRPGVWLGVVNEAGTILQSAYFSSPERLLLRDVTRCSDGSYLVVGCEERDYTDYRQFAMRISADFQVLWDRRYGEYDWENRFTSCCVLTNGDLIFVGSFSHADSGLFASEVVHASAEGYVIHDFFLSAGPPYRDLLKVYPRQDGYLIVSSSLNEGDTFTLFRMTPEDQVEEALTTRFDSRVSYSACTRTAQNLLLIAGTSARVNQNNSDLLVVCYSAEGDSLWSTIVGSSEQEGASAIVALTNGTFFVSGLYSEHTNPNDSDLLLYQSGQLALTFNPTQMDFGTRIIGRPFTGSFFFQNPSENPVAITAVQIPVGYQIENNWVPRWVMPGQESSFQLIFAPMLPGVFLGDIVVEHNGPGRTIRIPLYGEGIFSNDDWHRNYGGNREQRGNAIARMSDGGFVCAGTSVPANSGLPDLWVFRCNGDGEQIWSTLYDGPNSDVATCIIPTSDGGFAIGGFTTSYGAGLSDFLFLKFSVANILETSRTFGGVETDRCNALVELPDGGYALAGTTASFGAGGNDFWLVRLDANYDTLWTRTFGGAFFDGCQGGNSHDGCEDMLLARNGDLVLAGWTSSFQGHMADGLIIRVTQDGDSVWNHTVGGTGDDSLFAAAELSDGQLVFAGYSRATPATSRDMWAVGATTGGDVSWSHTYGGPANEECRGIGVQPGDSLLLIGYTESFGSGYKDIWTVDLTPWGDPIVTNTIGAANEDEANDVALDAHGNGFIAGTTFSYGRAGDAWIVHVMIDSSLALPPRPALPHALALLSCYPNPFNATTTIAYELPAQSDVTLHILNLAGQLVSAVRFPAQQAGQHEYIFDGTHLASGLYFANIQSQTVSATTKLVLLK